MLAQSRGDAGGLAHMDSPCKQNAGTHPSSTEHVIAAMAVLVMLEQHSRLPEAAFPVVLLCGAATLGLGVAYVVRLIGRARCNTSCARLTRRGLLSWAILPAAIALMWSSAATHFSATIRFSLSNAMIRRPRSVAYTVNHRFAIRGAGRSCGRRSALVPTVGGI